MFCGLARRSVGLILVAFSTTAHSLDDAVWNGGFEPAFEITGKVGYPSPTAGAIVEAHVGGHVSTTTTGADGRYVVAIEHRHLPPAGIVELIATDPANPTHVWAGALGPASRLLSLGGAAGRIGFDADPFVNLGPYSTAVAAALRAYNGFVPIADAATFYRASLTIAPEENLVFGLALIARGDLALPAGAPDTFAAVLSLVSAGLLYESVANLGGCPEPDFSAFCEVAHSLPVDPTIVAPGDFGAPGMTYVPYHGNTSYLSNTSELQIAYRVDGADGAVYYMNQSGVPVGVEDDGVMPATKRFARRDGEPIFREVGNVVRPLVGLVRRYADTTTIVVRPSRGPGGTTWHSTSYVVRFSYPDHPQIPATEATFPSTYPLPKNVAGGPAPAGVVTTMPNLALGSFVAPLPVDLGTTAPGNGRFGYDVHDFTAAEGIARRSGLSYTWQSIGTGRVLFRFGDAAATLDFVNEEEPGVWRVLMRLQADGYDVYLNGLVVPVEGALSWSPASSPNAYDIEAFAQYCGTPYGPLVDYYCAQSRRWGFFADGTLDRFGGTFVGSWSYAPPPFAGKLLLQVTQESDPTDVRERHGWERVRYVGGSGYLLKNFSFADPKWGPAPPIVFGPTALLSRFRDD